MFVEADVVLCLFLLFSLLVFCFRAGLVPMPPHELGPALHSLEMSVSVGLAQVHAELVAISAIGQASIPQHRLMWTRITNDHRPMELAVFAARQDSHLTETLSALNSEYVWCWFWL